MSLETFLGNVWNFAMAYLVMSGIIAIIGFVLAYRAYKKFMKDLNKPL